MDDINYECWSKDSNVTRFMSMNNFDRFELLEHYHLEQMFEMSKQFGWKAIIWQDPLDKEIILNEFISSNLMMKISSTMPSSSSSRKISTTTSTPLSLWFEKIDQINSNLIVQIWKDTKLLDFDPNDWRFYAKKFVSKRFQIILSSCFFLNLINYGEDWKDLYRCDPMDFDGIEIEEKQKFVLGGEAVIWTEYIDQTNLLSRVW